MKKASWILLALVALLIALSSLASVFLAYLSPAGQVPVGSTSIQELAAGRVDIERALRGQRGTAAAMGLGFSTLLLFVVGGPYRRGKIWAWWAILLAALVFAVVVSARVLFVGTQLGVSTALIMFGVVVVALLLDFRRLSAS